MAATFVGIDVAKDKLDIAERPSHRCARWSRTWWCCKPPGATRWPWRRPWAPPAVAVVNPRQVRAFARGIGQLAKTDALDAAVLARFAEVVHPTPRPLPEARAQDLSALVARRRQLVAMLVAARQRLSTALLAVRPTISRHIRFLEQELADLDRLLHDVVQANSL